MIQLKALSKDDLEKVRGWRNEVPETLRTPFYLTREMQEEYYKNVICNRNSNTRYWGIWKGERDLIGEGERFHDFKLVGYGGLENIIWEYGAAELSIIIAPDKRLKGIGKTSVGMILDKAFNFLRLNMVYGECYECANVGFWEKYCKSDKRCFHTTVLPRQKYYEGRYWDSFRFAFSKDGK